MKKASQIMNTWLSLVASVVLHLTALLLVFVAPSLFQARTATWGSKTGGHDGVNIKIVGNMSGINLPTPVVTSEEAVVSENKSVNKSEPEAKLSPTQQLENRPSQPNAKQVATERRAEAKAKGYEGDACGECQNYTLVRNGTCMKCDSCGATSGCS